jgi:hypothetical protein
VCDRKRGRKPIVKSYDLEVRTHSVPTAAALVVAGHEPTRIVNCDGTPMFCFSPEAEPALLTFIRAKQRMDRLAEERRR